MAYEFDAEEIKKRLFIAVYSSDDSSIGNPENFPHEVKGEFVLVPRICIGDEQPDGSYPESAIVTNDLLFEMEMDIDTVMESAKSNSRYLFPGKICGISEYLDKGSGVTPDGIVVPEIYILTNAQGVYGSSALFYQPELIENLSKHLGKDLLVFPAGENEMFCIPVTDTSEIGELQDMFREAVSELDLDEDKPLSAGILKYSSGERLMYQMDGSSFALDSNEVVNNRTRHGSR